ncbi:LON peptidase N-terminal domain and RING finger protein 3 [Biomphalaria glabrata]|nr:LON peptidase N-terminal domain and RING finger protein 3 [Biomphalaria glabrata]
MVDLAKEAFSTNNFGLAVDIYERTIRENGPTSELFLGLADSLALGGNFAKAFQSYKFAYRYGKVTPEKLKHLVASLIKSVKQDLDHVGSQIKKKTCLFTCGYCFGLLADPVTVPCGHTFCRHCLEKDKSNYCELCGSVNYRGKLKHLNSNFVLTNLIDKWFPNEWKAARLKKDGNEFFAKGSKGNLIHALTMYTEAIEVSPNDHLLWSNRSHTHASLDQFEDALADAEMVIKLKPQWPKGYFRKGFAAYGLGKYEDAAVAFLQCLALDQKATSAKDYLSKALDKILSALPPDDPKTEALQQRSNPTLLQKLVENNFSGQLLLPDITNTLQDLTRAVKDAISNTGSTSYEPVPLLESKYKEHSSIDKGTESNKLKLPDGSSLDHLESHHLFNSATSSPLPRKRSRNPSLTQSPLSPTHSSPQKLSKSVIDMNASSNKAQLASVESSASSNKTLLDSVEPSASNNKTQLASDPMSADKILVKPKERNVEDLECGLCYRLFYQPVTTPCGHTFCRKCLDRCLDHTVTCPMCKGNLAEYLAERRQAVNIAIEGILETYFKEEYLERCRMNDEEMVELIRMGSGQQSDIPVFVCTLSFPTISCPLHIFEPRYRLMIRQCMESGNRQFGMCMHMPDSDSEFSDFGCMLEIRDVQYFPDGRSVVDTVGGRRFKVLSRGKRDGYNTARVEFLSDKPITGEEMSVVNALQLEIHSAVQYWLTTVPSFRRNRIIQHFGELPEPDTNPSTVNGPNWAWWALAVLPLDPRVQLTMLGMCSFQDRLLALKKIIEYLNRRSCH